MWQEPQALVFKSTLASGAAMAFPGIAVTATKSTNAISTNVATVLHWICEKMPQNGSKLKSAKTLSNCTSCVTVFPVVLKLKKTKTDNHPARHMSSRRKQASGTLF
jgi:hypothetical protein